MTPRLIKNNFETVFIDESGRVIDRNKGRTQLLIFPLDKETNLEMIEIPAGNFMLGSAGDSGELEIRPNETPNHRVEISKFYLGRFPVTQKQWLVVTKQLPQISEKFRGDDLPVVNVWLEQALMFCAKLSEVFGRSFRLPSEAEWEYAARAGTTTPFSCGMNISTEIANFDGRQPYGNGKRGEFRNQLTPVGYFKAANKFGLYDMHGNVWEWCADVWHEDYRGAPTNGSAWQDSGDQSYCVQRGGSWRDRAGACRSAFRVGDIAHNQDNIVGLRVCLTE